jgi:pimeloyl-ACP methyl ester carboxylesterase
MKEQATLFGATQSLVGVITEPAGPMEDSTRGGLAAILLNPGIVHRVGPGRVYVKIARRLAAIGFSALRFDFSGIGDSPVRHDTLPFAKSAIAETQDAMEFLQRTKGIESFVLLGGCSGAWAAFETARCDQRVIGTVLINFQSQGDDEDEAHPDAVNRNAAHYYSKYALFDPKSWLRLFSGKTDYRQLGRVVKTELKQRLGLQKESRENAEFQAALRQLATRKVRTAFLCSAGDTRLDDLREAGGKTLECLCGTGDIVLNVIPRADHTFSSLHDQERLLQGIAEFMTAIGEDPIAAKAEDPGFHLLRQRTAPNAAAGTKYLEGQSS